MSILLFRYNNQFVLMSDSRQVTSVDQHMPCRAFHQCPPAVATQRPILLRVANSKWAENPVPPMIDRPVNRLHLPHGKVLYGKGGETIEKHVVHPVTLNALGDLLSENWTELMRNILLLQPDVVMEQVGCFLKKNLQSYENVRSFYAFQMMKYCKNFHLKRSRRRFVVMQEVPRYCIRFCQQSSRQNPSKKLTKT